MTRTHPDDALVSAQSLDEYFVTSVERAITKRKVDVRVPEVPVYLAHILKSFIPTEKSATPERDVHCRYHQLFTLLFRNALEDDPHNAEIRYRHLGDLALWITGIFPEHFFRARSSNTIAYYQDMGRAAYLYLGRHAFHPELRPVYTELSDHFDAYADVMSIATEIEHISMHAPRAALTVARIFQRYEKTHKKAFADLLRQAHVPLPEDHPLKN